MDVETLRKICLSFPAAKEDIKWEHDLAFTVGEKMFAVTSFDEPFKCSLKVADEQFDEYLSQEGFEPAPYLARAKWVLVSNESRMNKQQWEELLHCSYNLIVKKLTKKQRQLLQIQ